MPDDLSPWEQSDDIAGFGETLQGILGLFTLNGASLAGVAGVLSNQDMEQHRPSLVTVAELLELLRRGELTEDRVRGELGRLGYSSSRIDALLRLRPQLIDAGALLEMLRRGDLDEGGYVQRMQALGYSEDDARRLGALRYFLPPVQDVIRFMVREVFTPDVRQRFRLDEDFPAAALELTRKLGVRDEDAAAYWAAHWELVSPQQGFEMYQRSEETGVTKEDLDLLLRAHDVMPYWRDALVKIAFNPITRVDIRRMHKMGLLDHAGLVSRYRRVGYNPEDAELLAQFTEQLNGAEQDAALEPFRAPLRTRARSLYLSGAIDDAELSETFLALGYKPEEADAFIGEAALSREVEQRDDLRAALKGLYVGGYLTREKTSERLAGAGYSPPLVERILAPWDVLRELRTLTAEERADRDLTKAEIVSAYSDGLMPEDQASESLTGLGYSTEEADTLLAMADYKREKEVRSGQEDAIRAQFMARRIDQAEATSALGLVGVPQPRMELLIGRWHRELDARTPMLSVATITKAYKAGLLTREGAARRLDAMGYQVDDRDILLRLVEGGDTNVE